MQQLVTDALARPRLQTALGGLLGLAALLLAVIGIYGVIASSVGQRTRELGVRIALGASRATVFAAVLKDGLQLTAGGLALGLLAAAAVTRSLQRLLFEVDPLDPLAFAAGTGLMLLVAAIACAVPAAHASRVDPAVILRDE
jgi:ABC-type antimicrobial peptide transport system permease subunit